MPKIDSNNPESIKRASLETVVEELYRLLDETCDYDWVESATKADLAARALVLRIRVRNKYCAPASDALSWASLAELTPAATLALKEQLCQQQVELAQDA